jgi:two-component system capsular synthesis response regulator RcsB
VVHIAPPEQRGGAVHIRVVLADNHSSITEGARAALSAYSTIAVIDTARTPSEALRILDHSQCDVLVTEFDISDECHSGGCEWLQTLRDRYPDLKIVLHTSLNTPALIGSAIVFGVTSVINKRDSTQNLVAAILAANCNGRYLSSSMLRPTHLPTSTDSSWLELRLSRSEIEVLRLFSRGMTVTQIAEHTGRSIKTISCHKCNAMKKLGIERGSNLYRWGLLGRF